MSIINTDYCTCDIPEPEEVERGIYICLKCEKEIEPLEPPEQD